MSERHGTSEPVSFLRVKHLARAYRMYQAMAKYPHLMGEMRKIFLAALADRGIADRESIRGEALDYLQEGGGEWNEAAIDEYAGILIDLLFAEHFTTEEIENHINLARKVEAFQNLNRIVNTEGAASIKIKQALEDFCDIPQGNLYISPSEAEGVRVALISHFISNQLPFIGVAKNHITIRDVGELMSRSYWNRRRSGKIGGKAAGMFLAYRIILPTLKEKDPELERYVAVPESYYFNSGILSDFIDFNGLYHFHSQKYKSVESIEAEYANIAQLLARASFPPDVVKDFSAFLERVGERPLILRSSSLLEDSFEFTFSGKYDSVFIANRGEFQVRLNEFIWGLKRVLMSTFSSSAILYRKDHKLLDFDERMSVLVQEVVGRRFGDYFFPFVAGVAFSQNMYIWSPRIVPEDGLARVVVGLGTRAVDRTGQDYPRMIALSHPTLRPEVSVEQIRKYSQRMIDVLNLGKGNTESVAYYDLFREVDHPDLFWAVSVNEGGHLAPPILRGQEFELGRSCLTLDNFLAKSPFVSILRRILKELEAAYGRPVEIEFAWDQDRLYILQCRSLAFREKRGKVDLPRDVPRERILFTNSRGVSSGIIEEIEYIVYVDPRAYGRITHYEERLAVGRVVGKLNRALEGKRYALLGPVRWGSNDVNYGVKVGYADINRTCILGEVAFEEEGTTPEVSYGTHFFNDLVEAQIVPLAIHPDEPGMIFDEEFLLHAPNSLSALAPEHAAFDRAIHVIHVPSCRAGQLLHVFQDGQEQKGIGFFSHHGRAELQSGAVSRSRDSLVIE